jgi:hypothetical protein
MPFLCIELEPGQSRVNLDEIEAPKTSGLVDILHQGQTLAQGQSTTRWKKKKRRLLEQRFSTFLQQRIDYYYLIYGPIYSSSVLGAVQIMCDTFLALFWPPPPRCDIFQFLMTGF